MARRKRRQTPPTRPDPIPDWEAHIGRDPKGRLHFLGFQARGDVQAGSGLVEVAVVNVGRPFEIRVPSSGRGPSGMVIEGMTGANAEPWPASQVLAAARFGMFGFRLVADPPAASVS
jgi:hypothetical protein